ncbi:hypothetical protein D3C81_185860 [compost metagenome]
MRNNEIDNFRLDTDALAVLLANVKNEEHKAHALAFSNRLEALARHISCLGLNGIEAAELLRCEAARAEHDSQVQH